MLRNTFEQSAGCALVLLGVAMTGATAQVSELLPSPIPPFPCVISGNVVDQGSARPIERASVRLSPLEQHSELLREAESRQLFTTGRVPASSRSVTSGAGGHFCFSTVEPGRYLMSATKRGYLTTSAGASGPSETGKIINVFPGGSEIESQIALLPQSTITGRVLNAYGEPVDGGLVQAIAQVWMRGGIRNVPKGRSWINDLGEFRLPNLPPGLYYVVFQPTLVQPEREEEKHPMPVRTFFPSATVISQATPIRLSKGEVRGSVAILVREEMTYSISGYVETDVPAEAAGLMSIMPADEEPIVLVASGGNLREGNRFDFPDLAPGSYRITYLGGFEGGSLFAQEVVRLGTEDVEDLAMRARVPIAVHGRITTRGLDSLEFDDVDLALEWADNYIGPGSSAEIDGDGRFTFYPIPGRYVVRGKTPEHTVFESIRVGGREALARPVEFLSGSQEVYVEIGPADARLHITIESHVAQPTTTSAFCVVAPADLPSDGFGVAVEITENGTATSEGLAPGDYRVYAFESLDLRVLQNPSLLAALGARGAQVTVREGSATSTSVRIVSSEELQRAMSAAGF